MTELRAFLQRQPLDYPDTAALGQCLRALVEVGLDQLPLPGSGRTLERFQSLAAVAGHDLGVCKLYEGHTDALAIIEQLGGCTQPGSTWGMWAAEPPNARLRVSRQGHRVSLHGRKAWCSGAAATSCTESRKGWARGSSVMGPPVIAWAGCPVYSCGRRRETEEAP